MLLAVAAGLLLIVEAAPVTTEPGDDDEHIQNQALRTLRSTPGSGTGTHAPVLFQPVGAGQPGSAPQCYGNLEGVEYANKFGGPCIWNDDFCVKLPHNTNVHQCAIREIEVDAVCGAWDECAGVVCRPASRGFCFGEEGGVG